MRVEPDAAARSGLGLRAALDAGFVFVLTGVALYGLRSTFGGQQYLLVGLIATVLGIGFASLVTAVRRPVWWVPLLTVVAYYLFAGVLVFRSKAVAGFLPSGAVLRDATLVLADGWKQLLTTLPPVAENGRLLAVPYLIGLVCGAVGACTAQRSASRFAPAAAPVAALVVVILLGTTAPSARVWQGIAFGCLVVLWAAVRRPGARPLVVKVTPGGPQRIAIGLVVLAIAGAGGALLEPYLPGHGEHRVVLRDYVKPPFDIADYASPLVGFRKYTKSANVLYNQTLFTVRGLPRNDDLRIATLDSYDGTVWGATNGSVPTGGGQPLDAFQRVGSRVASSAGGDPVTATVTIGAPYASADDINAWVPGTTTLRSIRFRGPNAGDQAEEFRYNLATGSGITSQRFVAGDRYTFAGLVDTPTLPKSAAPYGAPTQSSSLDAFVGNRATQWSARAQGPVAQADAVARYMHDNGAYSDGGPGEAQYLPGHSTGRLTSFLNAPQLVGDDEQYAAAYALMCNYLGLPARVVVVAEPQPSGLVQGKNIHAAVEVHVRTDSGAPRWVLIPRTKFMPDDTKKPNKQPPQTQQDARAAVVPPPNPVHPPSTLDEPDRPDQNTQHLGKLGREHHGVLSGWFGTVAKYAGIPLLAILLICAIIIAIKWRRRMLRRTRGTVPNRFDAGWREFVDVARDLGAAVPGGRTRYEQAETLSRGAAGDHAVPLAAGADEGVFGPGDPSAEAAERYWRDVDAARHAMARAAGHLGRLRAALNVRSIRRPTRAAAST